MRWREIKKGGGAAPEKKKITNVRYAGFWSRFLGFVTDVFMIGMPISLLLMMIFGYDNTMKSADGIDVLMQNEAALTNAPDPTSSILQIVLSMAAYVIFWHISGQTPGKKIARIKVVDTTTYERASWLQLIMRFIGYFLSFITLIGFFIGLFRKDKRTLHDLISHTAVIYEGMKNGK